MLNGQAVGVETDPCTPLLRVLREEFALTGTKQGCDLEGECGACTVIVDGAAIRSCLVPVGKIAGRSVTTIEGIGTREDPHPLQTAFLETGAVQCGYCTPGVLLSAKALLDRNARAHAGRNRRRARRQYLSVYRLRQDHRSGPIGGRADARRSTR